MKEKLILVEDDTDLGMVLKEYLELSDFSVLWFQNPSEILNLQSDFNDTGLIILDVMMPEIDGFSLAKALRQRSDVPFLFLTAKAQSFDRILGLKLGADDYICKPCEPEELILRIKNILKRNTYKRNHQKTTMGDYVFIPDKLQLIHPEETIQLTEREVQLLLLLIQYNQRLITRDLILKQIWNASDYFSGRSMDVFISRLRKYFRYDNRIRIESVRSVGFQVSFPL